jgi:hypothetical protein
LLADALPPLRPAFFFWAVVPPWDESPPEPLFLPRLLEAPGELAIRAALPTPVVMEYPQVEPHDGNVFVPTPVGNAVHGTW